MKVIRIMLVLPIKFIIKQNQSWHKKNYFFKNILLILINYNPEHLYNVGVLKLLI